MGSRASRRTDQGAREMNKDFEIHLNTDSMDDDLYRQFWEWIAQEAVDKAPDDTGKPFHISIDIIVTPAV